MSLPLKSKSPMNGAFGQETVEGEGMRGWALFRDGGEGAGIEGVLVRHDSLAVARALYKAAALNQADRLIMLCDRARVLAGSDRPETRAVR